MKTLKDMNMGELRGLYIQWRDLFCETGCQEFRNNALEVEKEYLSRVAETPVQEVKQPVINVYYEEGYKWSVDVEGEEESRDSSITKVEAMKLARYIKRNEFAGKAEINAQTLTRKERSENMKYLHANSETYIKYLW